MAETALFIMFGATVVYVVLGNYLYFAKILPTLNEPPKFRPSGQLNDVERYLELIDEQRKRPWFEPILRNARRISGIYSIGFVISAALIFLD